MELAKKEIVKNIIDKECNFRYELSYNTNIYTLDICMGFGDCVHDKDCMEFQSRVSGTIIELNDKILSLRNSMPFIFDDHIISTLANEIQQKLIKFNDTQTDKIGW